MAVADPQPLQSIASPPQASPDSQCPEGSDGTDPSYREILWPGTLMWVLSIAGVLALAVAYARALGAGAGWVLAGGGVVLALVVLSVTSPQVRVDSCVLRAGRARLPLRFVGRVLVLDRDALAVARGPQGDPSAHMVTRAGVTGAVLVEVNDPQDPHHTWLVASRHAGDLARAITVARGKV